MKIHVERTLKTIDGEDLKREDGAILSVREVMLNSLLSPFPDERNLSGEDKVKRYSIAMRIHKESEPDLNVEELTLIKQLVGKLYFPLIVGQMWEILEGHGATSSE